MTKKEARAIIERVARDNAREWVKQVTAAGRVYYAIEKRNRDGDFWWVTLAAPFIDRNGSPALDFFWPSVVPDATDEVGKQARALLGESDALSVGAKAVGFDLRRRCLTFGGGGMDIAFGTLYNLGEKIGMEDLGNKVDRTSMNRSEGHL